MSEVRVHFYTGQDMKCQVPIQTEVVKKYLNRQLDEAAEEDFEVHILDCPSCSAILEAFLIVREDLVERAAEIRLQSRGRTSRFQWRRGENARMTPDRGVQRPRLDDEDLLEGWKAIADHLDKTELTVQRWEKSMGLPIKRLRSSSADEQGRVFAYKSELGAWWHEKLAGTDEAADLLVDPDTPNPESPSPSPRNQPKLGSRGLLWICATVGLAVMVLVFLLIPPGIPHIPGPHRPGGRVILAVRPLKDLGADRYWEFMATGLTEEMVTRLGQLHPQQMLVVRTSADAVVPADYVLQGSVRKISDRVAITAQLLDSRNQSVVWGQHYERDIKDLLRVQDEVADAITDAVSKNLPHVASPAREVNREAYLSYLEGRYFWNKRTSESLTRALALFKQSIASDPSYAPSHAGLADSYGLLGSAPYTALPPDQAFPKAKAAAQKALELDSTLAEAHVSLGYTEMVYDLNLPQAHKEFSLALQLNPDYATGHEFYAMYFTAIGDLNTAIAERKRALELDPVNPVLWSALGETYYQNREFDLAIQQYSRSLELDPGYMIALTNIGRAYGRKGMHPEARNIFQKILAAAPENPAVLALIGHEYAESGDKRKALETISHLKRLSAQSYVSPIYVALVYTGLHDLDNAFAWLHRASDEHCEYLVYLPSEPLADPLRKDPRFSQLLTHLGLREINATHFASN